MKITYKLEDFNKTRIINRFGLQEGGSADLYLSNACFKRMMKYVPWKTGALATTTTVRPGSVTYEVPYAHRQYVSNKGKGIRGKYWDKKMIANERDVLTREVEKYIKTRGSE